MAKQPEQHNSIMLTGFCVFLSGVLVTLLWDGNIALRIAGIVLIIASAALFGASLAVRRRKKRK